MKKNLDILVAMNGKGTLLRLSSIQKQILQTLYEYGELTCIELEEKTNTPHSSIVFQLKQLRDNEYVERIQVKNVDNQNHTEKGRPLFFYRLNPEKAKQINFQPKPN